MFSGFTLSLLCFHTCFIFFIFFCSGFHKATDFRGGVVSLEFGGATTQKELHIPILNGKLATRYTGLGHLGGGSDIIQSLVGPGLGRSQREDGGKGTKGEG